MTLKQRQEKLLEILRFLQENGDFDQAKKMFNDAFEKVSVKEITEAERALIADGLDPAEIQNLCTIHAEVFRGSISDQEELPDFEKTGHPVKTFKSENLVITSLVSDALLPDLDKYEKTSDKDVLKNIKQELSDLTTIDKHYTRKEISFFPLMTKYGITAPPQVMWGVDDDIRHWIRDAQEEANKELPNAKSLKEKVTKATKEVTEMIFKEEAIMLPLLADVATPNDWLNVKNDESQVGYTLINKPVAWRPSQKEIADFEKEHKNSKAEVDKWNEQISAFAGNLGGNEKEYFEERVKVSPPNSKEEPGTGLQNVFLQFEQGLLSYEQLSAMMDVMPFDIAFVDKDNIIRYFGGSCGFYPHSQNDLGMNLFSIHMPKSVSKVKQIVDDLRSGKKDKHEFWFEIKGRFVYIQYIAVRSKNRQYLGVLEVLQDATYVRSLKGQKKDL